MEAMEVDSPLDILNDGIRQPVVNPAAADQVQDANALHNISDSGSSTEVDEDEDDDNRGVGQGAARIPLRLPATWAFSQRAVVGAASTPSTAQGAPIRRRLRYIKPWYVYVSVNVVHITVSVSLLYRIQTLICLAPVFVWRVYYEVCVSRQAGPQGPLPQPDFSSLQRFPRLPAPSARCQRGWARIRQHHRGQRIWGGWRSRGEQEWRRHTCSWFTCCPWSSC